MSDKIITTSQKLNEAVGQVLTSDQLQGFEKAYLIAEAAGKLKQLLTPEYMEPIMGLQGNRLGFKTDKDNSGGYPESVVKNCLIEAVLTGVQPFGNQFNIIAGNCYITKEGFGYLLPNYPGLSSYEIIPQLPRISGESAAVKMNISWTFKGEKNNREIDFPIKVNKLMGTDAVIGKATRKARAWLFYNLSGIEVGDGDTRDIEYQTVSSKTVDKEAKEKERVAAMVENAKTVEELQKVASHLHDDQYDLFTVKMDELKNKE